MNKNIQSYVDKKINEQKIKIKKIVNTNSLNSNKDRIPIINKDSIRRPHENISNIGNNLSQNVSVDRNIGSLENIQTIYHNTLNIDNMSYEELLELQERIGFVSKGLKPEKIIVFFI